MPSTPTSRSPVDAVRSAISSSQGTLITAPGHRGTETRRQELYDATRAGPLDPPFSCTWSGSFGTAFLVYVGRVLSDPPCRSYVASGFSRTGLQVSSYVVSGFSRTGLQVSSYVVSGFSRTGLEARGVRVSRLRSPARHAHRDAFRFASDCNARSPATETGSLRETPRHRSFRASCRL